MRVTAAGLWRIVARGFHAAPLHSCKYRRLHAPATIAIYNSSRRFPATSLRLGRTQDCGQIPCQFDVKAALLAAGLSLASTTGGRRALPGRLRQA